MSDAMTIDQLLPAKAVSTGLNAASKKQLWDGLAHLAAAAHGLDPHAVFDIVWEREQLGSTAVGHGVAIPHGRVPGLTTVQGYFARLATPLNGDAPDGRDVDLVFMLLAPVNAGADHLQALAAVSRLLRDQKLCEQLRRAPDARALHRLITDAAVAQAA